MALGLVLGGIAQGAQNTWQATHDQDNADQAAADAHAVKARAETAALRITQAAAAAAAAAQTGATVDNKGQLVQPIQQPVTVTGDTSAPPRPAAPTPPPIQQAIPTPMPQGVADAHAAVQGLSLPSQGPAADHQPPPPPADERPVPVAQAIPTTASPAPPPAPPPPAPSYQHARVQGGMADEIRAQANNRHLPPWLAEATVAGGMYESGLNPDVGSNPNEPSSQGLMQFHKDTFNELAKTAGIEKPDMNDPHQQVEVGLTSFAKGARVLPGVLGRQPTPAELYIYHQQGAGGGPALLSANHDASAIDTLVDSGVPRAKATISIRGNWPHNKGDPIPSDPSVGDFLNATAARYNHFMVGGAPPTSPGTGTPGGPDAAAAQTAADGVVTFSSPGDMWKGIGGQPGVYDSPDGSGARITANASYTSSDDLRERQIKIYRDSGLPAEADTMQSALETTQENRRKFAREDADATRIELGKSLTKVNNVNTGEDWYNHFLPNGLHAQLEEHADGSIIAHFFDNNTLKPVGQEPFKSFNDLRGQVGELIGDPANFQKAMDASKLIAAQAQQATGAGAASSALAASTVRTTALGGEQSDIAYKNSVAAQARANAETQTANLQHQENARRLMLQAQSANPEDRLALTTRASIELGQMQNTTANYQDGMRTLTATTSPNGVVSIPFDKYGISDVDVNDKAAVEQAMDTAIKDKIPLSYRQYNTRDLGRQFGFYIASDPGLGYNKSADEIIKEWKASNAAKKPAQAVPAPNPGAAGPRTLVGDAINTGRAIKGAADTFDRGADKTYNAADQYIFGLPSQQK